MYLSFIVIAYNEENTLPLLLEDIAAQDYPHGDMEVLLVNSASIDNTRQIMEQFAAEHTDFRKVLVLDNPKKTLPCGWNVALAASSGDAVLKVDAHARIPAWFARKNVKVLESGEDIVGGFRPNVIDDKTRWKQTLLLAESSMFGSSIAPYRRNQGRRYVNSMFHAAYRREVFEKVGGFNEKLGRTEDNEIHYRMRKAGYRLCFDPEIISYQHIRSSLGKMLHQKYANGYWIGLTTGVCPQCLSLYHYVPFAFVLAILLSAAGLLFTGGVLHYAVVLLTELMWGLYWLLAVAMAVLAVVAASRNERSLYCVLLPILFFLLHISYGIGTMVGFIRLPAFLKGYEQDV